MRSAMPNAVFFAFSGTPIDKKNKSTYNVFGPLLDKYSFEESKNDGATLKIMYEDRMPDLYVEGADSIDHIFERVFSDLDQDTKHRLKKEYVTKEKIGEAPARIRKVCLDLIDHYTSRIQGVQSNGGCNFKGSCCYLQKGIGQAQCTEIQDYYDVSSG
jgi:type I restriction enzyme R subunit